MDKPFNSLYMGFFSETVGSEPFFEAPVFIFQFPLYGIFLWNRDSMPASGDQNCLFQFPLYGIFLWNRRLLKRTLSATSWCSFNSLYMGFFSETRRNSPQTTWRIGCFQFPLYGIFLWNWRGGCGIQPSTSSPFNSLYMGFFSETDLTEKWYVEEYVDFQFPLYGIFLWNTEKLEDIRILNKYFQFPLYGIFLWNWTHQKAYRTRIGHLSIPSIWDFSLKQNAFADWAYKCKSRSFNSLYMGFFSETQAFRRRSSGDSITFNSLYMGFFSETERL